MRGPALRLEATGGGSSGGYGAVATDDGEGSRDLVDAGDERDVASSVKFIEEDVLSPWYRENCVPIFCTVVALTAVVLFLGDALASDGEDSLAHSRADGQSNTVPGGAIRPKSVDISNLKAACNGKDESHSNRHTRTPACSRLGGNY